MPIFVGGTEINEIKIGNSEIKTVWVGGTKVWQSSLVSFTITCGENYEEGDNDDGDNTEIRHQIGYSQNDIGSISDDDFSDVYAGAYVQSIQWQREHDFNSSNDRDWYFGLLGGASAIPNSGWTKMTVDDDHVYNRTSAFASYASYHSSQGHRRNWIWTETTSPVSNNQTVDVVFE